MEIERTKLINMINDLKIEIKELSNSLRIREDTINFQTKQIEDANLNINNLENIIRDLELKNSDFKNEISDKVFIIQKESRVRNDRERDIENLNKILKDKEKEIQKYLNDLDFIQNEKNKLYEDNTRMFNEIDRLKKHIFILTDQNQQVNFKIFAYEYKFII